MRTLGKNPTLGCSCHLRLVIVAILLVTIMAVVIPPLQAQTFRVIYSFTGGADGAFPESGLSMDRAGNLYGTTFYGGEGCPDGSLPGCGTVFKLSRSGTDWAFSTISRFQGGSDGANPIAGVILGPDGSLYGTTSEGGRECDSYGCGTVFKLKPGPSATGEWTKTLLYRFQDIPDGNTPNAPVVFAPSGKLYGTTLAGGTHGAGAVYQLTPTNGGWTESVLYSFADGNDGANPTAGVTLDQLGNLYGTTTWGGGSLNCLSGCGTAFQLTRAGSNWTEKVLYRFQGGDDGGYVYAGLTFDPSGNLYGATGFLGSGNGGTVYELTPSAGNWTFALLYSFSGQNGPWDSLVMDAAANLYGTTIRDGLYQAGSVFRLSRSGGHWAETDLHDFTGLSDGESIFGGAIRDSNGHLYGIATNAGAHGYGVVWEIAP